MSLIVKQYVTSFQKIVKFKRVTFLPSHNQLTLLGPFGMTTQKWPVNVPFVVSKESASLYLVLQSKTNLKMRKYRSNIFTKLLINACSLTTARMLDVSAGVFKELCFYGRGWNASIKDDMLILRTNYSHKTYYRIPRGVFIMPIKKQQFQVLGINNYVTTHFLHTIIHSFKRDSYLGKGIGLADIPHVLKPSSKAGVTI